MNSLKRFLVAVCVALTLFSSVPAFAAQSPTEQTPGSVTKQQTTINVNNRNKKIKRKKCKKKAYKYQLTYESNSTGKVTYAKGAKFSKRLTITPDGLVTVKKGTKKGTYTAYVKVFVAATDTHEAHEGLIKLTVKVTK